MSKRVLWVLVLVAMVAAGAPAAAQETEVASLHAELVALNATMKQIAALLERQVEGQKLELVMTRVKLTAETMHRTEDALRAAEAEKASLEEQLEQLQFNYKSYFASLENSKEVPIEGLTQMRDQFVAQTNRVEARLRAVNPRVAELQNLLASQQTEVQEWQDFADRLLSAL